MLGFNYRSDIKNILAQKHLKSDTQVYRVWLANVRSEVKFAFNYLLSTLSSTSGLTKKAEKFDRKVSKSYFYDLIYGLKQHHVDIEQFRAVELTEQDCDELNKRIAKSIIGLFETNSINQTQKLQLKRLYYKWLRSLPKGSVHSYIQREITPEETAEKLSKLKPADADKKYLFKAEGVSVKTKKAKYLKWFIISQGIIAVIFTAVAQGLVPVAMASSSGLALLPIILIGLPSIIINLCFYKKSVKDLVKELNRFIFSYSSIKNLFKDIFTENKNANTKSRIKKIIALIFALGAGVTTGVLMINSLIGFLGLLLPFAPGVVVIVLASVITAYATLTLVAMYFTYVNGMIQDLNNFLSNIKGKTLADKIKNYFKDLWQNNSIPKLIVKAVFGCAILAGTIYLSRVESLVFFANAFEFLHNKVIALLMVVSSLPANLMFTTLIFTNLIDTIKNLPSSVKTFTQHLKTIHKNPVALYECIKSVIVAAILYLCNISNSIGTANGFAHEINGGVATRVLCTGLSSLDTWQSNVEGINEYLGLDEEEHETHEPISDDPACIPAEDTHAKHLIINQRNIVWITDNKSSPSATQVNPNEINLETNRAVTH